MHQHEVETELASASDMLDSTTSGHLAYVAKDGTPRVIPVGFYWTGEQFVISTAETAPKVAALSAHPDVALTIDAGGTPEAARCLSVRGRVDIRIVDGVVEEYFAAARKSMDPETFEQFAESCRKMYDRMARIAITPSWVRFYDYGTGRVPKFLQELAARNGL